MRGKRHHHGEHGMHSTSGKHTHTASTQKPPMPPAEEENDGERQHNILSCGGLFTLVLFILSLLFVFFLVYALFKFDTDAVKEACPRLHVFLNIRTMIGLIFLSSVLTLTMCAGHHSDEENCLTACCTPLIVHLLLIMYFLIFCIAGIIIVSHSMIDNKVCVDSLHDDVFKSPLLGILGWIYVAFDGLFSLIFIYLLISSRLCVMSTKSSQEDEQTALIEGQYA